MTRAQALMEGETRVAWGRVPHTLLGKALDEAQWHLKDNEFLLRGEGQHYFHYRKGHGITVERGRNSDASEESLWLNGSVYAAIASMNGLLPFHASAVAHGGKVFAFTGPAGSGKSTLVAALGGRGMPLFCDDTLVLDISAPEDIICLPGHKRLKLSREALDLTGTPGDEKVSVTVDKFYARPLAAPVTVALPLGALIFLEKGPAPAVSRIAGAQRFVRMQDDHYTSTLFAASREFDRAGLFTHVARLARQIDMAEFARPMDKARFDEGIDAIADYVVRTSARGMQ